MDSFNIKIAYGTNEILLSILPSQNNTYKIIYYGGILGTICHDGKDWELVTVEETFQDHLPPYRPGEIGERVEIELTDHVVDRIGWEIELELFEEVA